MKAPFLIVGTLLSLGLAGCASLVGDVRPFAPVGAQGQVVGAYPTAQATGTGTGAQYAAGAPQQAPMMVAVANSGSIFGGSAGGSGGNGLKLFQDNKARDVGDLLTIVLIENTQAKTQAKTAVTKDAGIGMSAPSIFGQGVTYKGRNILEAEVEGSRSFGGAGDSAQSNQLDGDITVTVVESLGNGNLLVRGQKQMRLNQGDELVQIQGIVRTADIGPDNRITSDRVGNAQIVYGGRGTLARSNAMGWLGRFFNSAAFPY